MYSHENPGYTKTRTRVGDFPNIKQIEEYENSIPEDEIPLVKFEVW